MNDLKVFDWEGARKFHTKESCDFLEKVYNTPISEDDFVRGYSSLPRTKKNASRCRCPSVARSIYKRLKIKFGFFINNSN